MTKYNFYIFIVKHKYIYFSHAQCKQCYNYVALTLVIPFNHAVSMNRITKEVIGG